MQVRIIRRVFVLTCLLVAALLIWAGVYARKQGLTNSWRQAIENDLAAQGHHVLIGKLTLGAFRGLVAEDVKIFRDAKRIEEIASLDDVYLDVGLERIFNKELSIHTLDVQNGRLTIPLKNRQISVTNLSGRIALTESLIEVVRVEANLQGLQFFLKGSMVRHPNKPDQIDEAGREALAATMNRFDKLEKLTSALSQFDFEPSAPGASFSSPILEVEFRGDLADLGTTVATASLKSGPFRKKQGSNYKVQSLGCEMEFDGRTRQLKIPRLELLDDAGMIRASGSLDLVARRLQFQAESKADIVNVAEYFFPKHRLGEVVFFTPPNLTMEGEIDLDVVGKEMTGQLFPGKLLGEFQTERFVTSGVVFNNSRGSFSLDRDRFYVRNIRIDHKTGVAFFNGKYEPGYGKDSFQFQTEVKMDPRVFSPFLKDPGSQEFLDRWHFNASSGVYLAAAGQCTNLQLDDLQAKGVIDLRDFEVQRMPFLDLETKFEINGEERWFRDLRLSRQEGRIQAGLVHTNTRTQQWQIENGFSDLNLIEGLGAFSPGLRQFLAPFRFDSPPVLKFHGKVDARDRVENDPAPSQTDLEISFATTGLAHFKQNENREFPFDSPKGVLHLHAHRAHLHSMKAGFCGGTIELEIETPAFHPSHTSFDASAVFSEIDLRSLGKNIAVPNEATGHLEGFLHLSAARRSLEAIYGHGRVSISDDDLWQFPAFQGLGNLLTETDALPRSGSGRSSSSFSIKSGVLTTRDLTLLGGSSPLQGKATLDLPEGRLRIEVESTSHAGKLYHATGSIGTPKWEEGALEAVPSLSER